MNSKSFHVLNTPALNYAKPPTHLMSDSAKAPTRQMPRSRANAATRLSGARYRILSGNRTAIRGVGGFFWAGMLVLGLGFRVALVITDQAIKRSALSSSTTVTAVGREARCAGCQCSIDPTFLTRQTSIHPSSSIPPSPLSTPMSSAAHVGSLPFPFTALPSISTRLVFTALSKIFFVLVFRFCHVPDAEYT